MDYRPGYNPYNQPAAVAAGTLSPSKVALLKKVYGLLTASVVFSAAGAMFALYAGTSASQVRVGRVVVPPLVYFMSEHWIVSIVLMFGAVFGASAVRFKPVLNVAALFGMAAVLGVVIAPAIFIAQLNALAGEALVGSPVRDAFVLAVAAFGGLSAYAVVSGKDFTMWRGALMMGLWVVIGASLLSLFVGGWHFHMAIESVAVLVFGGLVLYRTSVLVRMGEQDPVGITIGLYMSLLNLFMSLLSILGGGRRR